MLLKAQNYSLVSFFLNSVQNKSQPNNSGFHSWDRCDSRVLAALPDLLGAKTPKFSAKYSLEGTLWPGLLNIKFFP